MLNPRSTTPPRKLAPTSGIMPDSLIRTATAIDATRCIETLTLAFENDPVCRWVWPERQQFIDAFPRFVRAFGGLALTLGTAHYFGAFAGVSLWLPPGVTPEEERLADVVKQTASEQRRDAVFEMFDRMAAFHPEEAHWHLPLIGVRPANQGQKIGSSLQRHALNQCDRQQLPAYLEATSSRNRALYERMGYVALGSIQVADCPPITPMLRKPSPRPSV